MKKIEVPVIFLETFEIEIDETKEINELKDQILSQAQKYLEQGPGEPLIHECKDMPELIDD